MAKIDIKKITSGTMDGQKVWVFDFRWPDFSKKPIRKVLPQEVLIQSNEEIKKRIYYSNSHFVALNKKGEPLKSKIIPVFDNTGYRSYPGEPLNVFNNKEECIQAFKDQNMTISDDLALAARASAKRFDELKQEVNGLFSQY